MSDHSRFSVPEPSPGIQGGVLSALWNQQGKPSRMSKAEWWYYYLYQGARTLGALPGSNALTILTIVLSLVLFFGFVLVFRNVGSVLMEAGGTFYITAYIADEAEEQQVNDFIVEIEKSKRVRSVKYLSKGKALELFRDELGPRSGFLKGLGDSNPLPASIDVVLHQDELGVGGVDRFVAKMRKNPVVAEVVHGSEWVGRAQSIAKTIRFFGVVGILAVFSIVVFLMANTIKLVIYARREEIGIMKLVGATETFVRIPFFLSGLFQGFIGAFGSLLILRLLFAIIRHEIEGSSIFGVAFPHLEFLGVFGVSSVFLLGMTVGGLGSLFALQRFMDV